MILSRMAAKPRLNVQSFPRPPLLERTSRHLQIKWHDQIVADTKDAYWVLETHHPPSQALLPCPRPFLSGVCLCTLLTDICRSLLSAAVLAQVGRAPD